jgi:tetratricopeptide (TPR) repeat protein
VSRIEALTKFIAAHPGDPFPIYALAMEYKNANRFDEARQVFDGLMRDHADYVAAYLHAGNTLLALGDRDAARGAFVRGIEAATRRGDGHARGELESALAIVDGGVARDG